MSYSVEQEKWLKGHLTKRSGQRLDTLKRGHGYGNQIFLEKVWWVLFGNFNGCIRNTKYSIGGIPFLCRFPMEQWFYDHCNRNSRLRITYTEYGSERIPQRIEPWIVHAIVAIQPRIYSTGAHLELTQPDCIAKMTSIR